MTERRSCSGRLSAGSRTRRGALLLAFFALFLFSAAFSVSAGATQCGTPTFTPDGGTYGGSQSVYLGCGTPASVVRYTTNGNDPTTTDPIATLMSPVVISSSCTLKAKAWASGYDPSAVKSAAYVIQAVCATPTFSVAGGTYNNAQTLTITCSTSGATIYYTTDGSTPTTSSSIYSSAISVSVSETVKAIAVKTGYSNSAVQSAAYTLVAATPTFSPVAGYYATSPTSVTISSASSGVTIRYTTNGGTPTSSSTLYSGPVSLTTDCTLKAKAFRSGWTDSSAASGDYQIGTNRPATPTFSLQSGSYTGAQGVTLSCGTAGATITYTVDGTDPTEYSTQFVSGSVVVVGQSLTLKARAWKSGMNPGLVGSCAYTIIPDIGGLIPPPTYLYQVTNQMPAPSLDWFALTDVAEPYSMLLRWDNTYSGLKYDLKRTSGGVDTTLATAMSNKYYTDTTSITNPLMLGTAYTYSVRTAAGSDPDKGLPAPPQGALPSTIYTRSTWGPGPWVTLNATMYNIDASDCQTVDSRYDLRRVDNHYLDFKFGSRIYRGGLFAGYAADNSRVGRSFLKFPLSTIPTTSNLWAASLNVYYTRSKTSGTTNLEFYSIPDDSWTGSNLTWSNAPVPKTTGTREYSTSVTYNSSSPAPSWIRMRATGMVCRENAGDRTLSMGIVSASETSNGWAYFAKPAYDSSLAPHILYVNGAPPRPVAMSIPSGTTTGGTVLTGTITMNAASTSPQTIVVTSADKRYVMAGNATIAANSLTGTFTISTAIVTSSATARLSLAIAPDVCQDLTVTP